MMSRDYVHVCYYDRAGQLGESGSPEREGWREGYILRIQGSSPACAS
jgi:hypothetical protein